MPVTDDSGDVEVHLLDVGQGDSTLIVDRRSNSALLVDCPSKGVRVVRDVLRTLGDPDVVGSILTHWDIDHYGGLLEVSLACGSQALYYNRDTILSYPIDKTVRRAALRKIAEEPFRSRIRHKPAQQGVHGVLGNFKWELLAPSHLSLTDAVINSDRNLGSGVLRGEAYGVRVLIGGDADGRVWQRMIDEGEDLRAEVLRWPHHGASMHQSNGTSAAVLLEAVRPDFVIISVGTRNRPGHPDPEMVQIASVNARLGCTEVTSHCHGSLPGKKGIECGGTLAFSLASDGSIEARGGWQGHDEIVDGWDRPMCRQPPLS